MRDFTKLSVWQKAHSLTLQAYQSSSAFPRDEIFGLTSQLRRAASSIGANIAEGCGRNGNAELSRYLSIAAGSASELQHHLLLARDLGYLPMEEYVSLEQATIEIKRMLSGLMRRLRPEPARREDSAES